MKFLIVLALALAVASTLDITPRNIVIPASENTGRITNGKEAYPGQFPYQVGLLIRRDGFYDGFCGGSLIGNEWILSAAHCTEGAEEIFVFLGSTKRAVGEISYVISDSDVINHPYWDRESAMNDISLLRIPYTKFSNMIQPVQLPYIDVRHPTYAGENAIASGWGHTSDSSRESAEYLQYGAMRIIKNSACSKALVTTLSSTHLCTSTWRGVSTCSGDSGGPLVLKRNRVLVGITSFGSGLACEDGKPAVFTRVDKYLKWIENITDIAY